MGSLRADQPAVPAERVRVGYVSGAHGLRGALRVRMDNPASEILQRGGQLYLSQSHGPAKYEIAQVQRASRGVIKIMLNGISAIEQAEGLRGAIVMVDASDLPAPAPAEFYYYQAIG